MPALAIIRLQKTKKQTKINSQISSQLVLLSSDNSSVCVCVSVMHCVAFNTQRLKVTDGSVVHIRRQIGSHLISINTCKQVCWRYLCLLPTLCTLTHTRTT